MDRRVATGFLAASLLLALLAAWAWFGSRAGALALGSLTAAAALLLVALPALTGRATSPRWLVLWLPLAVALAGAYLAFTYRNPLDALAALLVAFLLAGSGLLLAAPRRAA